jgi:flagellar biogenesis protein FliO
VPSSFWTNYLLALATITLVLAGLFFLTRRLAPGRAFAPAKRRLVTVIESTMLSHHASVHVIKAGERYILLGAAESGLTTLAEMSREEVESVLRRRSPSTASLKGLRSG